MSDGQQAWQLTGDAAELYERYLVPAITSIWARDLVESAAVAPGERVVDVACGTGVVARTAALRVGEAGRVEALDLNPAMLAVARSLPDPGGVTIRWLEASATALPLAAASCDVALCQFGLQFFSDRLGALAEMHRVLVAGGRLALNVFGPIEHNPATHALADALDRHLWPGASTAKRTEHALSDASGLRRLVEGVGFRAVETATRTRIVRFPSVTDYVGVQLTATPLASLTAAEDEESRRSAVARIVAHVEDRLAPHRTPGGLAFPQEVHILRAVRGLA